jgi:hypothetical protein
MKKKLNWIPLKAVGPFKFGSSKNEYKQFHLKEIIEEYNEKVNWQAFEIPKYDIRIYFENDLLTSVACYQEIYFKDINLIGKTFSELKDIIDCEPVEHSTLEMSDGLQDIYEFDELALQVWVEKNKVVTIFCSNEYEE